MRTSLTMLILMTLICSTFAIVVDSSTWGTGEDNATMEDLEVQTYVQEYEPEDQDEDANIPVSASGRSEGLWQGDDLEIETSVNEVFEGIECGSRGAVNTSTLIYIKKSEKKVLYNQIFEMSGELLEDNNSDGEKNAGDYPIIGAWVDLLWNDGSEFVVQRSMQTQPDNPELNLTAGLWNITLQANETNIAANGDPNSAHSGVEFVVTFKGEWTTDGRRFYNLTPKAYNDLYQTKIGYDDDGDSVVKLYNSIDDDDDGEAQSPDSFLDGSNGYAFDGRYQRGEDVGKDIVGLNWIDLDHGLADYIDNDGDGELMSPDSYHDGSNGFPKDLRYQGSIDPDRREDIGRDRYESHYTENGFQVSANSIRTISIGTCGAGAVVNYTWASNNDQSFDLSISDGTTTTVLSDDVFSDSGSTILTSFGNYTLTFRNNNGFVNSVSYEFDVSEEQEQINWTFTPYSTQVVYLGNLFNGEQIIYDWGSENWSSTASEIFNFSIIRNGVAIRRNTNVVSGTGTYSIPSTGVYVLSWTSGNSTNTNLSYTYTIQGLNLVDPGSSVNGNGAQRVRNIGVRGIGTTIDYSWGSNGNDNVDFGIFDGVSITWLDNNVISASGTFVGTGHGNYQLIWRNNNNYQVRVHYQADIDIDWIDMNLYIADGIDNDGNGAIDEFIDEDIDDGRPGIDAVGLPETPDLWYNGVDDDGDGIVDDGYPGIKTLNNAEGVDEETYNGRDDDGDGEVDEDPYAFIGRRGYEKRMYVEIWHNTQTSFTLHESVVDIGDTFTLDGKIEDLSVPETNMGAKTMRMFFDGQFVSQTHADPAATKPWSVFDFSWEVPQSVTAGPHTITVEFSPAFNKTNNYYWNPSNASVTIHVRRPTAVIFDVGDLTTMKTYVYRGDSVWINGSIVDKIKYEVDKIKEGPRLKIGGYDYAHEYSFRMWWGDSNNYENYWPDQTVIDDNGTFSVGFDIRSDIVLGDWTIMIETSFKTDPMHVPLLYYTNSENQTKYQVRAKTDMGLWIDQNQNGEPDSNERDSNGLPLNTFITRKPFVGPDGRTYNWNYARIRGKLKDLSQSPGSINEGVAYEDITLYWGFSKSWQQEFELQTREDGEFQIDVKIETSHALGPVPVLVVFSAEFYSNYYDSSNYRDFDGMPFSVVSFTQLDVNASTGIKGKAVEIKGELLDDREVGIGNRTVNIYRKDGYTGNYDDLKSEGPGILIGSVVTNSIGKFVFQEYTIGEDVNVGRSFIVARFGGSTQFPDGPSGIRYYPNDAYMDVIAVPDEFYITSETAVVLDEKSFPDVLVRNGEARIAGQLVESFKGQPKQKGIGNMLITAYLKQGDEILRMGVDKTQTSAEFRGMFEIKTTNVPSTLDVGKVTVMVEFTPEPVDVGVPLYRSSSNITDAEIWSSTRVDVIQVGPVDKDGDRKIDLTEDEIEDWIFSFRVLEGATADSSGEPVSYATVWFNLSMGAYTNTTRGITDSRGKITFNFTQKFKDTATGATFVVPEGKKFDNLTIKVTFVGKHFFTSSTRTLPASYWEATTPQVDPPPVIMIIFLSLLLLIILIVSLFFFYRWIEKKRRLKALKRIIKKAADQLETGNPYSAVIFKSYQKLGAHLRRYGFMRRDADTFREFEDAVRTALPIDDRALDSFLDLLEEARYSKHVIGEGHRDKAIGCLRNVENSLDNIMLDEESALRQMELQDEEFVETEVVLKER